MKDRKSVLIVDDDEMLRNMFQLVLEDEGCSVKCCGNGKEALALAGEKEFDVIIADYYLPSMNGAEMAGILRRQYPKALIIGMSGKHDGSGFREQGVNVFMRKPFDIAQFLSIVNGRS